MKPEQEASAQSAPSEAAVGSQASAPGRAEVSAQTYSEKTALADAARVWSRRALALAVTIRASGYCNSSFRVLIGQRKKMQSIIDYGKIISPEYDRVLSIYYLPQRRIQIACRSLDPGASI